MIKTPINLAAVLGLALLMPTLVAAQTPAEPVKPADPAKPASPADAKPETPKATLVLPGGKLQKVQAGARGGSRVVVADDATIARINEFYGDVGAGTGSRLLLQNPRINVHLDNVPIQKAFETIFAQAGGDGKTQYQTAIEGDVPKDKRVTLHADNVRLSTALELLCEAGDVNYNVEMKDGKTLYHVGKNVKPTGPFSISLRNTFKLPDGTTFQPLTPDKLQELKITPNGSPFFAQAFGERRSTFTCPHCKGQATVIRKVQTPECPKCGRAFRADWQFCPFDGAKRPATTSSDWKYCPICGKRVEMEKSDAGDLELDENKIPVLGDLPYVGRLFRTRTRIDLKPAEEDQHEELRDHLEVAPPGDTLPLQFRYNLDVRPTPAPATGDPDGR